MAAKSFLRLVSGKIKSIKAIVTSSGAANDGDIVALDSTGRLDESVMPIGVGPDVVNVPSFEDLDAGEYVNLFDDSGTIKARLADAENGRPAHGFVKANVTAPAAVNVFFEGPNENLSGLTLGSRYYLATAGGVTTTPKTPDDSTDIHQFLGVAVSATAINTDIADCVEIV